MKIPREFQRELFSFVSSELVTGELIRTPCELSERCGRFARRWFGITDFGYSGQVVDVIMLVAWAERFGKHVGEFFLTSKGD